MDQLKEVMESDGLQLCRQESMRTESSSFVAEGELMKMSPSALKGW